MNGALFLIIAVCIYLIAYRFYGRYLLRFFPINKDLPTPAHTQQDGVDYCPTKAPVLFGHHFASIAGAGPIVGPVLGACFGWVPVALWIILGCVFIGAVHDFTALFVSVRNQGLSIGHVVERYLGYPCRQIFLFFCFAALLLVIAIFALLIAKTFVAAPPVATSSLIFIALAVLFGFLVYKGRISLFLGSFIFIPLLFAGIYAGTRVPLDLVGLLHTSEDVARQIWLVVLLVYVYIASVVPVWILLQPRDYLNSFLLYSMILSGVLGILIVAPKFHLPAFAGLVVQEPTKGAVQWALFPILYVTVACGACSGFHALVSSGTTSKQISSERHILPIGYGAMLVEGIVAVIALVSVAVLSQEQFITILSTKGAVNAFAGGLANFLTRLGLPEQAGLTFVSLTISAFMLTTLDTATRLTRFTLQEMTLPKKGQEAKNTFVARTLGNRYIATLLVVIIAGYLVFSGDAGKIWPVFGASNQLLAALTLLVVTVMLIIKKSNYWITLIPFLFMLIMSSWALVNLFTMNWVARNWSLLVATIFLLILAGLMVVQTAFKFLKGGI